MKPVFIAEIGINHHGDFDKAVRMIKRAKYCGADFAKFQYYDPEKVLGKESPYLDYVMGCYLPKVRHEELKRVCDEAGISYLVSVFDDGDVKWADGLCSVHKIATRMNQSFKFIEAIEKTEKPVFMSIQKKDQEISNPKFSYMWCVAKYPSTKEEILKFKFDEKHGLSSHCFDYRGSVEAYKQGARLFENHVCEDRNEDGCDILASLTFDDYKRMLDEIKG